MLHFPFLPVVVRADELPKATLTRSPGDAQPQTAISCPCCNTILEPKMAGNLTSAKEGSERNIRMVIMIC